MPVADSPRDAGTGDSAPIIERAPQEQSGVLESLTAGYRSARAGPGSTRGHENAYASDYYDKIVTELNRRGHKGADEVRDVGGGAVPLPRAFVNPFSVHIDPRWNANPLGNAQREIEAIWSAVERERRRDPSFLKETPDRNGLRDRINRDRQRDYAEANDVLERAGTAGTIAGFIGQVAAAPFDPENWVGAGAGGAAGKTVAQTILKSAAAEGGINAAGSILALPGMEQDAANLGIEMTPADMARQIAANATFGAVVGGGKVAIPAAVAPVKRTVGRAVDAAIENLPEPVRDAVVGASIRAGTVADRAVVSEVRRAHSPYTVNSTATPDETAAINTIERDADIREASPFNPGQEPENDTRLAAVMDALGVRPIPAAKSSAPLPASHPSRRSESQVGGYAASTNRAEGYGKNPSSSASGYGQFIDSTWLSLYRKSFGGKGMTDAQILSLRENPDIGRQMTELYGQENGRILRVNGLEDSNGNRSLAHFLGPADAVKVLRAAADTPIERIIAPASYRANEKLLRGKSASEIVAWAHRRIGEASGEPVGRADAVPDIDTYGGGDTVSAGLPPVEHRIFDPSELTTDAAAMQYKSGGDASGVTDRLRGVEVWNPLLSGKVIVWERADGIRVVADGHQRLGLAQRIAGADPSQNVKLDGILIRETDGVSAQMARVIAALKNIEEGSGTAIDTARVLRDAPDGARMLSPNAPGRRMAMGLVGLSNEAFGAVLNDVIDARIASQIGLFAAGQLERHMALVQLLKGAGVTTPDMAGTVVRQALTDGFGQSSETQLSMFGDVPQQSLYGPAARVLDSARRRLKDEKRSFRTLTKDATRIEQAGNQLDRDANLARVIDNETALAIIDATAHSSGPVRDALLAAARQHLEGDQRGAVERFLNDLDGIDLQAAAAGMGNGAADGVLPERTGYALDGGEADAELAGGRGAEGGASPYDEAVAAGQSSLGFSDPISSEAAKQATALEHDLRMDLQATAPLRGENITGQAQDGTMGMGLFDAADQPTFRLSEEGDELSFPDIIERADSDIAAIEALGACL